MLQRLTQRTWWVQSFNYGTVFFVGELRHRDRGDQGPASEVRPYVWLRGRDTTERRNGRLDDVRVPMSKAAGGEK